MMDEIKIKIYGNTTVAALGELTDEQKQLAEVQDGLFTIIVGETVSQRDEIRLMVSLNKIRDKFEDDYKYDKEK